MDWSWVHELGVVNSPSKTMGPEKCLLNFMGLAVLIFFSCYVNVHLAVLIFFTKLSPICLFVFIIDVWTSQSCSLNILPLCLKHLRSWYHNLKSQNSPSRKCHIYSSPSLVLVKQAWQADMPCCYCHYFHLTVGSSCVDWFLPFFVIISA